MTIDVIGHQWWWEVRYPLARDDSGTGPTPGQPEAVTANEIHPVAPASTWSRRPT